MIKLLIADDHIIFREGLKLILTERKEDILVVGEAYSGKQLIETLNSKDVDIILMDILMPEIDGLEATRYIKKHFPHIKVLVLSMIEQETYVAEAIKAGASGYLFKNTNQEELIYAIQTLTRGEQYFTPQITLKLLNTRNYAQTDADSATSPDSANEDTTHPFSKRELEVLQLIAKGYTNAAIADQLYISKRTVESHRQRLLELTASKNTASLIMYAYRHHLLDEKKIIDAGS
jgi:DNA-binding NarL/FixJ family response regulator